MGNYFHSYFESPEAHEQFIADHADVIFKKQTKAQAAIGIEPEKYAPYVKADEMIAVAEADPLIKSLTFEDCFEWRGNICEGTDAEKIKEKNK